MPVRSTTFIFNPNPLNIRPIVSTRLHHRLYLLSHPPPHTMLLPSLLPLLTLTALALADFHITTSSCKSHTFCPSASRECNDVDDALHFSVDLIESNQFNCDHFIDTVGSTTSLERLDSSVTGFESNFCGRNLKFVKQAGALDVAGWDLFDTGTDLNSMRNVGSCVSTFHDLGNGAFAGDAWQCSGDNIVCHQSRVYICLTEVCN